jgi:hypothetical protein
MKYTVTWTKSADLELAAIWLGSSDRKAVSSTALEIDRILRIDAHLKGTELSEGLRVVNLPPLRFLFSANEADRVVEIAVVREI